MTWQHPHDLQQRSRVVRAVVLGAFGILTLAFFRAQVLSTEQYRLQSEDNRLREVRIPAPRGLITDRHGVVLAENVPGYSVAVLASSRDTLEATLERLADVLPLDDGRWEYVVRRYNRAPTEPVVIERDAPFARVSALEELRAWNPGLVIQSDPKRRYPFGDTVAHVVGYVGEITEQEVQRRAVPDAAGGMLIGRGGVERQYDARLRGRDGVKFVEYDALGRMIGEARADLTLAPQPGATVQTTIDIELQRFIVSQFPQGRRGAAVAMDPRTGEILALHSAPTYDPNAFIGGIEETRWQELARSEDYPLFNRAIQGRYAPASPFKLAIAAMALRRNVVTMDSRMAIPCRGGMRYYNRYFRCWRAEGHGDLTLSEAIQFSCDVYFYQLGLKLGLASLLQDAGDLGFRDLSGIDLPNEYRPVFPPSAEYYNERYGPRGWTNAVTLNLAIGQGENSQTLINMVRFYAMLASPTGSAPAPRVVAGGAARMRSLGLFEDALTGLREALVSVVSRGTAAGAQIADLRVAGKTGTAQNPHGPDHGWFIAFAPADEPAIVVGAIVEFAEHGSSVAPFVTRVIARHLLGPDAIAVRARWTGLQLPADSAPEPVPILPDTGLVRRPASDTLSDAQTRPR